MITIQGRYSIDNRLSVAKEWTMDEIRALLQNHHHGMMSMFEYWIDGKSYFASGISLGDETFPYEEDGWIKIPTYFPREMIVTAEPGDPKQLIQVDVFVEPKDSVFVTIVKDEK